MGDVPNGLPSLPRDISSDGREIWEWGAALGRAVALQVKRRELSDKIARARRECGTCALWMTRACPREVLDAAGRKHGPSMSAPKCSVYTMNPLDEEMVAKWDAELAALCAQDPAPARGTEVKPAAGETGEARRG